MEPDNAMLLKAHIAVSSTVRLGKKGGRGRDGRNGSNA